MSVYVDDMNYPFRHYIFSHMYADTEKELHEMADRIKLNIGWFQNKKSLLHYDISLSKKKLAIRLGAVPVKYPNHMRKFLEGRNNE